MYVAIFATMLMSIYFDVPLNSFGSWIFWLCGAIVACVGLVAMLIYRKQWAHIMLSICAGLLCGETIAAHIVYLSFGVINTSVATYRIILTIGFAVLYYAGYMRKYETAIDGKRCALYAAAVLALLVFGRFGNVYYDSDYQSSIVDGYTILSNFNVYMLLAELAAASFIVVCDKSFSKYYAVGVVGFAGVMAFINLATHSDLQNEDVSTAMVAFAFISKIIPVVGITAVYCCYTLIGKLSDEYYPAAKIRSVGTRSATEQAAKPPRQATEQTATPVRSATEYNPSKSRPIEKSEIDFKLERLESLKADGTLDDEEYKNEVIKLLGGKNNVRQKR